MTTRPSILSTMPLDPTLLNKAMDSGILLDALSFIGIEDSCKDPLIANKIKSVCERKSDVVFTSANAVNAVCKSALFQLPDWRIHCVARATLRAVLLYFPETAVAATADNAAELAEKINELADVRDVTFFCGDKRLDTLPSLLRQKGVITDEVMVYKTVEQPQFVEKEYNAVLFYSPSGVSSFFSMNAPGPETVLFAIGSTTAEALALESTNTIITCDNPSKELLLYTAISYFKDKNQL